MWHYVLEIAICIQLGVLIDMVRKVPSVENSINLEKERRKLKRSSDKLKDAIKKP